ncbi:MAG: ABC transporter permease [Flavobacteriaceae bacterium]|nr:ABC transporter permease [Flavobacteriaceae bacterium]MBT3918832.1 ABC transporter permease [Flavobacteriaceae bacterium]MBT6704261.1 ABC transporter permease [Flavobacteriaceae bacterium]
MNFPLYIAKRYLFSKSSKNAINIISKIAISAVVVGSFALFIVLSGFSGLRSYSLQFTTIFDSDLKVYPANGKTFAFSKPSENKLKNMEGIDAFSKIIEERVFLQYRGKNHIALIKGVDENFKNVIPIDSILFLNKWLTPDKDEVVIGLGISQKLSMGVLDYGNLLEIYVPKPGTGQIINPTDAFTKRKVIASGMYSVNQELDNKYVFSDIEFARSLLKLDTTKVSSLELKLIPNADSKNIRQQLKALIADEIIIKNRIQQNDGLYKMLNIENLFVYIFVSLIAAIAIFNIAGTIIMTILEKRGTINTLSSFGLTIKEIRKIFFYKGVLMTLIGLLIGLFLGIIAVFLQQKIGFIPITPSLPYPVRLELFNVIIVFVTILVLGGFASKIAATRVSEKLIS